MKPSILLSNPVKRGKKRLPKPHSCEAIKKFHLRLQNWYRLHGRHDLPWRKTTDPYHIYLSEVMLQQTQVKTVLSRYYFPFLKKFSTLAVLARAKESAVLKAWEGLGYYNRALNLHRAAKQALADRTYVPLYTPPASGEGKWGKNLALSNIIDALMRLPGIGRNTAHAIAAFAYRQPAPVMEANVKRVLHRVFALKQASLEQLWEKAWALLDKRNPFDYNQAMMDIGAMICTKRNPSCPLCPANSICRGQFAPELYPSPKAKKLTPVRQKTIVVFTDGQGKYFVQRRKTKFLNGLYGFMEYEGQPTIIQFKAKSYKIAAVKYLGNITQTYSHFILEAEIYQIIVSLKGIEWRSFADLLILPLSKSDYKILKLINKN